MRQFFRDFGSLAVGFKLAVIVSGLIGAGSFAKWVIDVWYPATRNFWSHVAVKLELPELTNYEKDSLTALVFFLPFGISAVIEIISGKSEEESLTGRLSAAVLGLGFLYLVCRDLISSFFSVS